MAESRSGDGAPASMGAAHQARAIILRRRAKFIASAVGFALSTTSAVANADDNDPSRPKEPKDPKEPSDDGQAVKDTAAIGVALQLTCVIESQVTPEIVQEVKEILILARALHKRKELGAARAQLERAIAKAYLPEVADLDATFRVEAGQLARARAALEARVKCSGWVPVPDTITAELASLRDRTASLQIDSGGSIKIDGVHVSDFPILVYVDVGSHHVEVRTFDGRILERRLAFAGGEVERIEIDGGEPHVCLSVCLSPPPWRDREERGPLGITIGPSLLGDVAGGENSNARTNPFVFGAAIAPFLRVSGGTWIEARVGAVASPSGSVRGFTMPTGAHASMRLSPSSRSKLSLGLGVTSGYLIAPAPSRATALAKTESGPFETAPSFFIEPHIPMALRIDRFEIEQRLGLMWSGQEDAVRSRFALSYVTWTIGFSWISEKSRSEELAVRAPLFKTLQARSWH